jgi:hypothetical protein
MGIGRGGARRGFNVDMLLQVRGEWLVLIRRHGEASTPHETAGAVSLTAEQRSRWPACLRASRKALGVRRGETRSRSDGRRQAHACLRVRTSMQEYDKQSREVAEDALAPPSPATRMHAAAAVLNSAVHSARDQRSMDELNWQRDKRCC